MGGSEVRGATQSSELLSDLIRQYLVKAVAVVLQGHSAVWLNILHLNSLVQVHHKLTFRMDLERGRERGGGGERGRGRGGEGERERDRERECVYAYLHE